jgi:hypothetical protein
MIRRPCGNSKSLPVLRRSSSLGAVEVLTRRGALVEANDDSPNKKALPKGQGWSSLLSNTALFLPPVHYFWGSGIKTSLAHSSLRIRRRTFPFAFALAIASLNCFTLRTGSRFTSVISISGSKP